MTKIVYFGIAAALIFAKLAGVIGWSWWVVLLPLLIPAAFFCIVFGCALGTAAGILYIIMRKR